MPSMATFARSLRCLRLKSSNCILSRANKGYKCQNSARVFEQQKRRILSAAFSCEDLWSQQHNDPILSEHSAEFLLSELFGQFEKNGAASAVDIEVFSNKVHEVHPTQLHMVESLLKKLRRSVQGLSAVDSMSHAVIRGYLHHNQTTKLIDILQDKMSFGIFPDDHAFCLILDHFIKAKDFTNASLIAVEMMLQEDFSHPTAQLLALHACSQYIETSKDSLLSAHTEDDKPTLDEEEDEYIPIKWIPLHNFDDHFDITDRKRQIGKTLVMMCKSHTGPVFHSYKLVGLAMSDQFDLLFEHLENYLKAGQLGESQVFHKEVLELISLSLEACKYKTETIERDAGMELKEDAEYNHRHTQEQREIYSNQYEELKPRLESLPLLDTSLVQSTEEIVTRGVSERTTTDITEYTDIINRWAQQRKSNVSLQERAFSLSQRQQAYNSRIKELTEKEELLNYFVRQNDISLALVQTTTRKETKKEVDMSDYVAEPGKRGKKVRANK